MATAAAPTYFNRHRGADDAGLIDGGVWCNNSIALAVVEAITLLGWPRESLRVLRLGCAEEVYMLGEALGLGSLVWDVQRLFMDGQSHGAMGMAKLLTGHEYERDAIFRCCPHVPKDFFSLDDTSKRIDRAGARPPAWNSPAPEKRWVSRAALTPKKVDEGCPGGSGIYASVC